MKNGYLKGMIAGAIAGVADGAATNISFYLGSIIGFWETFNPSFILTLFIATIEWNVLWGALFGVGFVIAYPRLPSNGVKKGLIFSLIFYWLLADIRSSQIMWSWGTPDLVTMAIGFAFCGLFASIAFGLVIGILYKE